MLDLYDKRICHEKGLVYFVLLSITSKLPGYDSIISNYMNWRTLNLFISRPLNFCLVAIKMWCSISGWRHRYPLELYPIPCSYYNLSEFNCRDEQSLEGSNYTKISIERCVCNIDTKWKYFSIMFHTNINDKNTFSTFWEHF